PLAPPDAAPPAFGALSLPAALPIFMRKDPPVDKRFIHTTYVLDQAAAEGVTVTNPPATLRDFNEKIFASTFAEFTPPYTITPSQDRKSTRLNSSHVKISYAVFCLKT